MVADATQIALFQGIGSGERRAQSVQLLRFQRTEANAQSTDWQLLAPDMHIPDVRLEVTGQTKFDEMPGLEDLRRRAPIGAVALLRQSSDTQGRSANVAKLCHRSD